MAGVLDRYRRIVVDDQPVVTGLLALGNSWACMNPIAGRGFSLGIAHAIALRDAAREFPEDPARLAESACGSYCRRLISYGHSAAVLTLGHTSVLPLHQGELPSLPSPPHSKTPS
jgi:2-polyprenyl-6-methoxyphenol hydroxylase-like FAD-dependent oxidoreductase